MFAKKNALAIAVGLVLVFLGKDFLASVLQVIETVSGSFIPAR